MPFSNTFPRLANNNDLMYLPCGNIVPLQTSEPIFLFFSLFFLFKHICPIGKGLQFSCYLWIYRFHFNNSWKPSCCHMLLYASTQLNKDPPGFFRSLFTGLALLIVVCTTFKLDEGYCKAITLSMTGISLSPLTVWSKLMYWLFINK